MKKLQIPLKKVTPSLFPSNLSLKIEILSSPPFLKIWWEVYPPSSFLPPSRNVGGAHYGTDENQVINESALYIRISIIIQRFTIYIATKIDSCHQQILLYKFNVEIIIHELITVTFGIIKIQVYHIMFGWENSCASKDTRLC